MTMKVLTVASTTVNYGALEQTGYVPHYERLKGSEPPQVDGEEFFNFGPEWEAWFRESYPHDIDELHEAAGRYCYVSHHRPNPATATNKTYLGHIIEVGHLSVLGHGHVSFYVSGVSRALLLELERHQQRYSINFSVLSQRYVDHGEESSIEVVRPPIFNEEQAERLEQAFNDAQAEYDRTYNELRGQGYTKKEARGAARAFLPENTETRFLVTGSIRAWRNIIEQRLSGAADAEIREFARLVLIELSKLAPNSMQDLIEQHEIEESK